MKKGIRISIISIIVIGLLLAAIFISKSGGSKISEGTYYIENCEAYPNAYITVSNNEIQFHNIDLNALYRKEQLENYNKLVERGTIAKLSDSVLNQVSDLNYLFVSNAWKINYDEVVMDKNGTFTYVYFCMVPDTYFGKVIQYDSLRKTIQLNDEDVDKILVFKE